MQGFIIFAAIAIFLGLRLYAVLGRRTGHEQTSTPLVEDLKVAKAPTATAPAAAIVSAAAPVFDTAVATGLKSISFADSSFDLVRFIEGARSAYKSILEAFWRGDQDELATLVSDDVRETFAEAITERNALGHTLDNRLVQIEKSIITRAWVENKVARITVQFVADVAAVTRDKDGAVVAGSLTDAVPTTDVWTFARQVRSPSPEWTLTETDESA